MATLKPLPQLVTLNEKAIWEDFLRINADIATLTTSVSAVLADAVILAPASSTRNRVQPTGAYPGLILRAPASGTPNLLEFETAAGASLAYFNNDGQLTISRSSSGTVRLAVQNTNSSSGDAAIVVVADTASNGNPMFQWGLSSISGPSWTLGIDNSDVNTPLILASGSTIGNPSTDNVEFGVGGLVQLKRGDLHVVRGSSGGDVKVITQNTSVSSSSRAILEAVAIENDALVHLVVGGSAHWSMGLDYSDSQAFIISESTALGTTNRFKIAAGGTITLYHDVALPTVTGTKLGTSTSQLLGFWNATPVAQYNTTGTVTGFTAGSGTAVLDDSTFTGNTGSTAYTIGDIVRALKLSGIMAA